MFRNVPGCSMFLVLSTPFVLRLWAPSLLFVLCLCGSKFVVLYYASVAAKKKRKKKEKISSFVACVTVGLKLVVLYYACGAANL